MYNQNPGNLAGRLLRADNNSRSTEHSCSTECSWMLRSRRHSSSHQCNVALTSWRVGARLAARPWRGSSGSAFCTVSGRRCPAPLWRVVNNYSYTGLSPSCRWPCQPCSLGPDTTWVHQKEHPESDLHWPVHFEVVSEVSLSWANAVGPHLPGE